MAIMTVAASGGVPLAAIQGQAVDAGPIALGLLFMAACTIRGLCGNIIVRVLGGDIGMATGAGVGLMDRGGELRGIDKKGDLFAGGVGF